MSIEYSTIVGYGHMLGDAEVAILVDAGLVTLHNSDLAGGGFIEELPALAARWPNLRLDQSHDMWSGSIDSKVLALTSSSVVDIDMKTDPTVVPARIRTGDDAELAELTELAEMVGVREEPGFYVGGSVM